MSSGRHRGYFDRDFRSRDADVEISGKIRPHKERIHDEVRGLDSRVRVRNRNLKVKELMNGSCRSLSGTSNSSDDRGTGDMRDSERIFGDREPGELSAGSSGSDDLDAPQSIMVTNGVVKTERISSSLELKRKFSPILWDKKARKKSTDDVSCKSESDILDSVRLPLPPPLPEGFVINHSTGIVRSSEDSSSMVSRSLSLSVDQDKKNTSGQNEPGEIEDEEEYAPTRNISSSRWAGGDDSDDDEAEPFKVETCAKLRKGMPMLRTHASTSPEIGEVAMQDVHDSTSARSFGSDANDDDSVDSHDTTNQVDSYIVEEDVIAKKTLESVQLPQRTINMLLGCRSVDDFERLNKIDEGTYGVVFRAKDKKSGEIVALKKVKMEKEREGFPLTALREINILLSISHPSIVDVKEVVVGNSLDSIFMVMEYMDHDLKGLMESMKQPFSQSEVKCLMLQLLEGVKCLHDNWVLHRDLKTSNLLFNNRGELKICDCGLSRQYGSPLKPYTHLVVTLWYRSPELLLGMKEYSTAIDMWSLGCIMAELLAKEPLFNGKTEFDQLDKIFRTLGTPNEKIWPGFTKLPHAKVNFVKQQYNKLREKFPPTSFTGGPILSEKGFDLMNKFLTYDPVKRITVDDALNHEWFKEVPLPKSKVFMPTFPALHAQERRHRRILKSPDPLEEQRQREFKQGGVATGRVRGDMCGDKSLSCLQMNLCWQNICSLDHTSVF